ncbi:wsc domain-containing protein [Fusarium avenaceum]|nr:wsc domain-containing protein [Fusarium avenaceum]
MPVSKSTRKEPKLEEPGPSTHIPDAELTFLSNSTGTHLAWTRIGCNACLFFLRCCDPDPGGQPCSAFFRLPCGRPVTLQPVDPIANPEELSAHAHTVIGGNGFNSTMNFDTARASTCTTCKAREGLSNYWIPNLYYRAPWYLRRCASDRQHAGVLSTAIRPQGSRVREGLACVPRVLLDAGREPSLMPASDHREVPHTTYFDDDAMDECRVPVQANEKTIGVLETLPGYNPVTFGPKPASPIAGEACNATNEISPPKWPFTDTKKFRYLGCGKDAYGSRSLDIAQTSADNVTIESCLDYCEREGYLFVGLEYGRECYCGNAVEEQASSQGTAG